MIESVRLRAPAVGESAESERRRFRSWMWLALVCAALVPYANALQTGFVFDDWIQIRGNPALRGELDWFKILAVPLFPGNLYRPLTIGTFALDHAWFGWQAWWFHLENVLLHAGVTVLVALLGLRLFTRQPWVAWLGALLFAVHPIHTEAVTGLVGRAELLAALFSLVAMLAAVRAEENTQPWRRRAWMALALASFTLALSSKESAITALPLVLLLRIALRAERWWEGLVAELRKLDWLGFVACALAVFALRALALSSEGNIEPADPLDNILASIPAWQRVATALAIQWMNWSQFLVPLVLSADYSYPQIVPVEGLWNFGTAAGLALIAGTIVWGLRARGSTGFALLFPWVAFAVTSNVLFPIGTVRGERLAYFPSVGWCWWLAALLVASKRYVTLAGSVSLAALIVLMYAGRTYWRNFDWVDQGTLFARTAQDAPRSAKAQKNYAVALRDAGQWSAALEAYERAWALYPHEEGIAFGAGEVADRLGRVQEAEAWYRKALELEPRLAGAWNNLCRLYVLEERWQDAERACRNGLRLQAAHPNLWKGLGLAWIGAGRTEEAKKALEIALHLAPDDRALREYLQGLSRAQEDGTS